MKIYKIDNLEKLQSYEEAKAKSVIVIAPHLIKTLGLPFLSILAKKLMQKNPNIYIAMDLTNNLPLTILAITYNVLYVITNKKMVISLKNLTVNNNVILKESPKKLLKNLILKEEGNENFR